MKRIAWFSPIALDRPLSSAVYTRLLLPELSSAFEIEVFTDDPDLDFFDSQPESSPAGGQLFFPAERIFHHHRFGERDNFARFDLCVYQIEDCSRNSFCYRHQRLAPGLALRHDLNLNRMFLDAYRHSTGGTDIDNEIAELFGPTAPKLGQFAVRGWPIELFDRMLQRGISGPAKFAASIINDSRLASQLRRRDLNERLWNLRPAAPAELFPLAEKIRLSNRPRIGITACREHEHRVAWTAELLCLLETRKIQPAADIVWVVHPQNLDPAARKIAGQCAERYPWLQFSFAASNAEYFRLISSFDLFLLPILSAGRSMPLELKFARACGIPVFLAGNNDTESRTDPGIVCFLQDCSQDAVVDAAIAVCSAEFEPLFPPPPAGSPYSARFTEIVDEIIASGLFEPKSETARSLARSSLHRQILAESPSPVLNANYRELVNRTFK